MEYSIDYNELLKDRDDEEYVYIIEGCYDIYVSNHEPSDEPCQMCGSYDWIIDHGLVKNLKKKNKPKQHKKIKYPNK